MDGDGLIDFEEFLELINCLRGIQKKIKQDCIFEINNLIK